MPERLGLSRRLAYKDLRDSRKSAALPGFLEAATQLHGLSFTILVDRRIRTLFQDSGDVVPYLWKAAPREKAMRVMYLGALLVAGLSSPGQDVFWFTDEDEIAANAEQLTVLTDLFARVSTNLLRHNLGHLRCGTAASDPGDLSIEDLVAIPDVSGGAAAAVFGEFDEQIGESPHGVFATPAGTIPVKAQSLFSWFANPSIPLRRQVCVVRATDSGRSHHVRLVQFPTWPD